MKVNSFQGRRVQVRQDYLENCVPAIDGIIYNNKKGLRQNSPQM